MNGTILKGLNDSEVKHINPDISYGKFIFDILSEREDSIALVDALLNKEITYKELFSQSIRAAKGLIKLGIKKNDVIAVVSENCLDYSVPILACLYIGAICNPVNPAYTLGELKDAFNISKPKAAFVSLSNLQSVLSIQQSNDYLESVITYDNGTNGVINMEHLLTMDNDDTSNFLLTKVNNKEDVAFILCSSGTTGLPKGVELTHYNLIMSTHCLVDARFVGCSKSEITIGLLPFFHAFGMLINMAAWTTGMKIVLLSKFKPETFLCAIQNYKVTKLFLAPPLVVFLAKSSLVDEYNLTSITDIICAAAPLGNEIQQIFEKRLNVSIRQGYGMTETGFISVIPYGCRNKVGSAGKLVYKTIAKIRDIENNAELGANQQGEICIKSETCMKGYLKNIKATQDVIDEDGYLRTGDIGYIDEDGFMFIVDRLKELIKYKGFQVAPAELEDLLTSHSDIADACVVGIPHEGVGELPMAYIVKKPGRIITEDEIIAFVAEHLSIQKQLHGGVRFIEAVPKSATGKILRKNFR